MKKDPFLPCDLCDLGNRLDGPHIVVGKHHSDERGFRGNGPGHFLGINHSKLIDRKIGEAKSLLLKKPAGLEDGRVLYGGRNHVSGPLSCPRRQSLDGKIIGFRAAAHEHDLVRLSPDEIGNLLPRPVHGLARLPAEPVGVRRVSKPILEVWHHLLQDLRVKRGGGVMVKIDPSHTLPFLTGSRPGAGFRRIRIPD